MCETEFIAIGLNVRFGHISQQRVHICEWKSNNFFLMISIFDASFALIIIKTFFLIKWKYKFKLIPFSQLKCVLYGANSTHKSRNGIFRSSFKCIALFSLTEFFFHFLSLSVFRRTFSDPVHISMVCAFESM